MGNTWDAYGDGMYLNRGRGYIPDIIGYRESKNVRIVIRGPSFNLLDMGGIEGKRKHVRETAAAQLSHPCMIAAALVEAWKERDVASAVVWQAFGWVGYDRTICHYKAILLLDSQVSTQVPN